MEQAVGFLTKSREQELQGAQMKMIRSILWHTRVKDEKGEVESWVPRRLRLRAVAPAEPAEEAEGKPKRVKESF